MNERIRIDVEQARKDGNTDGLNLITELCNLSNGNTTQAVRFDPLAEADIGRMAAGQTESEGGEL